MDFINKIFSKKKDDSSHSQFVRFGKGSYENRALLNFQKGKQIRVSSSFEYSNDFVMLLSEFSESLEISGVVISKKKLEHNLLSDEKIKSEIYYYSISGVISSADLLKILADSYRVLADIRGSGFEFKCKKKLPKPGKSEKKKVDDKFCVLKADLSYLSRIHDFFFPDLPLDVKKVKIKHTFIIEDIIKPEGEKDFEKIRLLSKRKGRIIRHLEVNKQSLSKEIDFEV